MTKPELHLILQKGEGYHLEFKEAVNTDLAKEMCAFANASGGRILLGISDKNIVTEIADSNSLRSKIQDIAGACDPPISIKIEAFQKILIVHVSSGLNKPYRCTKGFFIRNGANCQKMTTAEITAFVQAEGRYHFDEIWREDLSFEEVFEPTKLKHFLSLAKIESTMSDVETLQNLSVLTLREGMPIFNNAGVLFFTTPPPNLRHCITTCALFKGNEKLNILDRKDFSGSILQNIDDAMLFLKQHLKTRYEITSVQRKEIQEIPDVSLREALVNALCHRDYFEKGANVMIEVFDDRVDITNPGGLPRGLSPEKFGRLSVTRNPLIAALLLRCGYIEKMGTGIRRIQDGLAEAHCQAADIDFDAFFSVSFPRIKQSSPDKAPLGPSKPKDSVPPQVVSLLRSFTGEHTRGELQDFAGLADREHFRNSILNPALTDAWIERTIPEKPNSRLQKYRITENGKALLVSLDSQSH